MSDLEDHLISAIHVWIGEHLWDSEEEVSSAIAMTNYIFTEVDCELVDIHFIDNGYASFTAQAVMYGEPRKDDVSFYGDKIYLTIDGEAHFNDDQGIWEIDSDYATSAKVADLISEDMRKPFSSVDLRYIISQESFTDPDELIIELFGLAPGSWYRGHSDEAWQLKTSIARQDNPTHGLELELRLKFENQTTFLHPEQHPLGIAKCNFLMQHHGIPTRLLDWTASPLIALYFAVCDEDQKADGCIWQLNPSQLNRQYYREFPFDLGSDHKDLFASFTDETLAIHAPYTSLRMNAQQSEFTLHSHYEAIEDDKKAATFLQQKLIIDKGIKPELKKRLAALGIKRSVLFPDLDNISKSIADDTLP